jgi:hypothetical protein
MGTPAGEKAELESMEEIRSRAVTGEGGLEERCYPVSPPPLIVSSSRTFSLAESLNCVTKAVEISI